MKLQNDSKMAIGFKKAIHGSNETYFLAFPTKNGGGHAVSFFGKLTPENIEKIFRYNTSKYEIAMQINSSVSEARGSEYITKVNALFVDIDSGDYDVEKLKALSVKPHFIVATSPSRCHVYWLIDGCVVEKFSKHQKALAVLLGGDEKVCDLARLMRLPGTINWKHEKPFLCKIVYKNDIQTKIPIASFVKRMKLRPPSSESVVAVASPSAPVNSLEASNEKRSEIADALQRISPEDRDDWLRVGMAINSEIPDQSGYLLWVDWAKKSTKFDEVEHKRIWSKFKRDGNVTLRTLFFLAGNSGPAEEQHDECSLSDLFVEVSVCRLRFVTDLQRWFAFDGGIWRTEVNVVEIEAKKFIAKLFASQSRSIQTGLRKFRQVSGIRSITSQAALDERMHAKSADFDSREQLFAVGNGVIYLPTGKFRPATALDMLARRANIEYVEDAKCPLWLQFIDEVTCGDKRLARLLQRALGYSLFGHAKEQVFFLLVGGGGNGKGVLMRIISQLLGDYAQSVAPNLLTSAYSGNPNSPSPAIEQLEGARFIACSELPTSRQLDKAFVKQLAGGDTLTARGAYAQQKTFKPTGKLWISANDVPEIAIGDRAMWRRLIPIPFLAQFTGERADIDLEAKLLAEGSGILNWLLNGAKTYAEKGALSRTAIQSYIESLKKEADSVQSWLDEACIIGEENQEIASEAHESYMQFARGFDRKPLAANAFSRALQGKGFARRKTKRHNVYDGFSIRGD